MVFMVLEIFDAQSGGSSLVTTADVHPIPEIDLEVKLEQEEGEEEGGGDDDDVEEVQVESAASALLLLSQPKLNLLISLGSAHCGKVKINTHFISYALSVLDLFCK